MYIEYPKYSCKDIKEKSMKGNIGCCGNIKWCDKKLNKDKKDKKEGNENYSKIATEIKKVKKKQKENNKGE